MQNKILIVDDEVLIAEDLKDTLSLLNYKNVRLAHKKTEALKQITEFGPDLVLLDIRMEKEKDGIEIGNYLKSNTSIPFIYITSHSDMALINEIIQTKPFAYITKPFNKTQLLTNVSLALQQAEKKISIKDGYNYSVIGVNEIIYIASESNYINLITGTKRYILRQSLESFLQETDTPLLVRIHRSYVVNIKKVKHYTKTELTLSNAVILPISRTFYSSFESIMTKEAR